MQIEPFLELEVFGCKMWLVKFLTKKSMLISKWFVSLVTNDFQKIRKKQVKKWFGPEKKEA